MPKITPIHINSNPKLPNKVEEFLVIPISDIIAGICRSVIADITGRYRKYRYQLVSIPTNEDRKIHF